VRRVRKVLGTMGILACTLLLAGIPGACSSSKSGIGSGSGGNVGGTKQGQGGAADMGGAIGSGGATGGAAGSGGAVGTGGTAGSTTSSGTAGTKGAGGDGTGDDGVEAPGLGLDRDPWTLRFFPLEMSNFVAGALLYFFYRKFKSRLTARPVPLPVVYLGVLVYLGLLNVLPGEFIFVTADELSFHPQSKHQILLGEFFA